MYGENSAVCEAKRSAGQVAEQHSTIRVTLASVERALEVLANRLSPILRNEPEGDSAVSGGGLRPVISPLADNLADVANRLNRLESSIADVTRRIDL